MQYFVHTQVLVLEAVRVNVCGHLRALSLVVMEGELEGALWARATVLGGERVPVGIGRVVVQVSVCDEVGEKVFRLKRMEGEEG